MTWRALAVAAVVGLLGTACGDDGRTTIGDRYVWVEQKVDRTRPVDSLRLVAVFAAPGRSGRPSVMVGSAKGWSEQAIDDEAGFVTDVMPFGDRYLAVGAVGAQSAPDDLAETVEVRSAIWIGDEHANWTQVDLPAPADGPSWLIGIERERGFVAVGNTAGSEGDVFALRSENDGRTWTATTVAGGPGLQLAGAVVANVEGVVVAGVGTTWSSVDRGPWTEAPLPAPGDRYLPTVGADTIDGALFVAAGPSRAAVTGDVVLTQLAGRARATVEPLDDSYVLAAAGLERDLVLLTQPWGDAERREGADGRLRLVRLPPDGPAETWPLPVRSRDVDAVTVWPTTIFTDTTFVAIRHSDGSVQVAGLGPKDG